MDKPTDIEMKLPVALIREGDKVVAYTPALDISTVGKDESQAKERFNELVNIFFEDLVENDTVEPVLTELGWIKEKHQWSPPIVSQESVSVRIPAFA